MDASTLPKGQSQEVTEGVDQNLPGIYKHKDTGATFITAAGEHGVLQADAMLTPNWKDAWERVGDVPSSIELQKMRKVQLLKDTTAEAAQKKADEAEIEAAVKGIATEKAEKLPAGGETYEPEAQK